MNKAVQIAADDWYPSRRQTAVIAVLCRGLFDNDGTNQMQQTGLPIHQLFPNSTARQMYQHFLKVNFGPLRYPVSQFPVNNQTDRR